MFKGLPNQRRQTPVAVNVQTLVFNDSSRTPRAYFCMRSTQACHMNTTGASPLARCMYVGHCVLILNFAYCLNSGLVVKF